MELRQKHLVAEYRLLFMQPDPESGERVCVGIIIDNELMYDREFSRVRCISPKLNIGLTSIYLESLRDRIAAGSGLLEAVKEYAPLFLCSSPRQVTLPLTAEKKLSLFEHFVKKEPERRAGQTAVRREQFVSRVHQFAFPQGGLHDMQVIENASAEDVIGREDAEVEPVAVALRVGESTILLDGIDLNKSNPKKGAFTNYSGEPRLLALQTTRK